MRLSEHQLKNLIEGVFLTTILLAAQDAGRPLQEATWILVGVTLVTVADGFAWHLGSYHDGGVRAYLGSLVEGILDCAPRAIAALPTVLILFLAAMFHWRPDQLHPDGSASVGYETVVLNINVVLLFIFGFLAARRSGSSWRGTIIFALINAALGWVIVTIELALE
jgi:hypothetical protein